MARGSRLLLIVFAAGAVFALGFAAGIIFYRPMFSWYANRAERLTTERFLGKPAPEVQTTTLDGKAWRLSDQKGKVVLIDFWATWCAPCTGALPTLKRVQERYGTRDDFELVGVSLDDKKEPVEKYLEEYEIGWTILFESGAGWENQFARKFRVQAIPSLWVVDKSGTVSAMHLWDQSVVEAVAKALGELHADAPPARVPGR
jgi:thiol-disulfide isomerase/thioredoxin